MVEWYNNEPNIEKTPVVPVSEKWLCAQKNCDGAMVYNGTSWPTGTPGYHHTCDECGYTTVLRGKRYPRITHIK